MNGYEFISQHIGLTFGLIAAVFIAIILIIVAFFYLTKNRKVAIGQGGVSIDAVEKTITDKLDQFMQLRTLYDDQRDELNRRIWDFERNVLMERYMSKTEEHIAVAVKAFRETHENLIAAALPAGSDVVVHPEVRRYHFIMRNVYYELKESCRMAMRKNGFIKKNTAELHQYAMNKLESMMKMVENLVDTDYESGVITIKELREAHRAKRAEYGQMLMQVFIDAKIIAVQVQAEIDGMKAARQHMQKEFCKNNNVVTVDQAIQWYYGQRNDIRD